MKIDLWVMGVTIALNVAVLLYGCRDRYRIVIGFPSIASLPRPAKRAVGQGESRLAEDLDRFRQRVQEHPTC